MVSGHSGPTRGTKRKRTEPKRRGPPPRPPVPTQEALAKKMHHGIHEARKAAKKEAAFELRKLVKRLKEARAEKEGGKGRGKGADPAEMERQLEVLKHLDLERIAHTALRTKILKDRLLAENEDAQAALAEKLPAAQLVESHAPGSSEAKVRGRMLSSKTLAEAVKAVVESLREVVQPSVKKTKPVGNEDDDSAEEDEEAEGPDGRAARSAKGSKVRTIEQSSEDESGEEHSSDEDAAVDDAGWESGSIDNDEILVASGSPDEDGSSEDEEDDAPRVPPPPKRAKTKDAKPAPPPPAPPKSRNAAESMFLPSLSVGFTRGDSSASEWSDADGDADDVAPKKNRRGQRARRAIWEKKYGRNANHVKNESAKGPPRAENRPSGRAARPGAPPRDGGRTSAGRAQGTGGARPNVGRMEAEKPLHPSWEAKKKLKEKLNPTIVPAQGQKIKF